MHLIISTELLQLNKFEIYYHKKRQHDLMASAAVKPGQTAMVLRLLAGPNSAESRIVSLSLVCARPATSRSEFSSLPRLGREPLGPMQQGARANTENVAGHRLRAVPGEQCFIVTRVPGHGVYRFNITDKGMNLERC